MSKWPQGVVFCLSGTMSQPQARVDAHVREHGGTVIAKPARADFLVIGNKPSPFVIQSAIKNKTPIITEQDLYLAVAAQEAPAVWDGEAVESLALSLRWSKHSDDFGVW